MAKIGGNTTPKRIPLNESADLSSPLRGYVICCTSVPDEKRTEIAKYAEQMGAVHRYDLTLDVTHLIVADYNTAKYRYVARERQDIQPMTMEWIEAVRELWMNDKEIDLTALEIEHRLPTFHSLKFSMTGCDDPQERSEISEMVKNNGATYEGDLTKQITHLVSFRTEGAKYKAAKAWKLHIVSPEWLRDSIERGMILDEALYDPVLPTEERGKGAWDKTKPKRISLGKRSREGSADQEGGRRKLRRTASTKLSSQSAGIWGDIVGGGMVAQVARSGVWDNTEDTASPQIQRPRTKEQTAVAKDSSMQSTIENPPNQGIFGACRFFLYGFAAVEEEILRGHLNSNDAEVSETIENLVHTESHNGIRRLFRIVPHDYPSKDYPIVPEFQLEVETITVWWVERCLHSKKFLEPSESIIGRPFPIVPIAGFSGMSISSSAFWGIELLHFKKAVELIGATYSENMTPQSAVLVTKSVIGLRKDKSEHAQDWNIPILTADWLWESIETGQRLPFAKYRLRLTRKRTDSLPNPKERPDKVLPRPARSKSDILKGIATSSSSGQPSNTTRPPRNSGLDDSAFADDEPSKNIMRPSRKSVRDDTAFSNTESNSSTKPAQSSRLDDTAFEKEKSNVKDEQVSQVPDIKDEEVSQAPTLPDPSSSTQDLSMRAPPLSERSANSPTRTVSTAPVPSEPPPTRPQEDISNAISTLLAKTKTAAKPASNDSSEGRKRGGNRILGRVTSNVSSGSANRSRATSVDSTASHGHPVQYPSYLSSKTANDHIDMLVNGDRQEPENLESQLSSTQVQYDDPDSTTAREMVMARMNGEKINPKRIGIKEKAVTVGDFAPAAPRSTRRTGRGAGTIK